MPTAVGYTDRELSRFSEDPAPGLVLLRDWRESNGATIYCTDVLVSCLQQMEREDVAHLIQSDEAPQPVVFISYQWNSQVGRATLAETIRFSSGKRQYTGTTYRWPFSFMLRLLPVKRCSPHRKPYSAYDNGSKRQAFPAGWTSASWEAAILCTEKSTKASHGASCSSAV